MKPSLTFAGISCLVILLLVLLMYRSGDREASERTAPRGMPSAIGSIEQPAARLAYDLERLASPVTGRIPPDIRRRELAFIAPLLGDTRELKGSSDKILAVDDWQRRGPYNVGGRTRALAVDITDPSVILAGGVSGGMWRSSDGGITWSKRTRPTDLHSVSCVVQDQRPGKTNIWYYGSGEWQGNSANGHGFARFRGDGIFKSTDRGLSWRVLPATQTRMPTEGDNMFDFVWSLAIDTGVVDQDIIYAACYGGINRSSDGGLSWTSVLGGISNRARYTDVAINSLGHVYATLDSSAEDQRGIWRSTDGLNFSNILPEDWPGRYQRVVVGVSPDPDEAWFYANTPSFGLRNTSLWKYTYLGGDGTGEGGRWENRSANLPQGDTNNIGNINTQFGYNMLVHVHPSRKDMIFLGGTNLYRSVDGFSSSTATVWIGGYRPSTTAYRSYLNHHPDQHLLTFLPAGTNEVLSAHDGGVSRSLDITADEVLWQSLNNGYLTTQFYTIAIDNNGAGDSTIIGGTQDNGTWFVNSMDSRATWSTFSGGDGSYCEIADDKRWYIASAQFGYVMRFLLDEDGTVLDSTRVDPDSSSGYRFLAPLAMDPNRNEVLYLAANRELWRNSDVRQIPMGSDSTTDVNWRKLLTTDSDVDGLVTAISPCTLPATRLYYATNRATAYRLDFDASFESFTSTRLTDGLNLLGRAYISCLAVDPSDGDRLLMVISNYETVSLYFSDDAGASWDDVAGNLEEVPDGSGSGPSIGWASILPYKGRHAYFVATSIGLFASTEMRSWRTRWAIMGRESIGNVVIDMVKTRPDDAFVAVATHGAGIFTSNIDDEFFDYLVDVESPQEARQLNVNTFPNPFAASIAISFTLAQAQRVSLAILDEQARTVRHILSGHFLQAGEHTLHFDGLNSRGERLPSGVYFYRIETERAQRSGKIVMVR